MHVPSKDLLQSAQGLHYLFSMSRYIFPSLSSIFGYPNSIINYKLWIITSIYIPNLKISQ